uniref:C2H2-type domain-containing protein n=1 Tax=Rhabditophanes sp. KR3021 TaxID=114890 RepID=A0AC35U235_9BILA
MESLDVKPRRSFLIDSLLEERTKTLIIGENDSEENKSESSDKVNFVEEDDNEEMGEELGEENGEAMGEGMSVELGKDSPVNSSTTSPNLHVSGNAFLPPFNMGELGSGNTLQPNIFMKLFENSQQMQVVANLNRMRMMAAANMLGSPWPLNGSQKNLFLQSNPFLTSPLAGMNFEVNGMLNMGNLTKETLRRGVNNNSLHSRSHISGTSHTSSNNIKKYRCDVCDKTFSRSNTLITHKRIHTGEKPFCCEHCGRAFRQPGNLTRHRLTHTTNKPFVCSECNKAFNRASNLHTHMRTHIQSHRMAGVSRRLPGFLQN